MKSASQIAKCLSEKFSRFAKMIFPNSQLKQGCWQSLNTEQPISITLEGDDRGQWVDEKNKKQGDLIDLLCLTRKISIATACFQEKQWIGIENIDLASPEPSDEPPLNLNFHTSLQAHSTAATELEKNNKLTFITLNQFKCYQQNDWLILPYFKKTLVKQIKRSFYLNDHKAIKEEYEINKQTLLFGWQALPNTTRTVTLTLDEIDTMSLHQMGIASLAIPFDENNPKALSWVSEEFDDLSIFDKIYFAWHENNKTAALTELLRERLGRYRCYHKMTTTRKNYLPNNYATSKIHTPVIFI